MITVNDLIPSHPKSYFSDLVIEDEAIYRTQLPDILSNFMLTPEFAAATVGATPTNGLTSLGGTSIGLGGILTQDTDIDFDGFKFNLKEGADPWISKNGTNVIIGGLGANTIGGISNNITILNGLGNEITGSIYSSTEGDGNTIVDTGYSHIRGTSNTISNSTAAIISGDSNNLSGIDHVTVIGSFNSYTGISNKYIFGDGNANFIIDANTGHLNSIPTYSNNDLTTTRDFLAIDATGDITNSGYSFDTIVDASNGLTKNSSNLIKWGGALTNTTNIDGAYGLYFGDITRLAAFAVRVGNPSSFGTNFSQNVDNISLSANDFSLSTDSTIYFDTVSMILGSNGLTGSANITIYNVASVVADNGSNNSLIVQDTINSKGIVYAADYSPNFTDESLITKRYTDAGDALKLNLSGGTLTGALILNADATSPLQAVTYQQLLSAVTGLYDLRGGYDASSNLFPTTGGSGTGGAINKADVFIITVAGTLGGTPVAVGDEIIALVDTPAQTAANWAIQAHAIGYTPLTNVLNSGQLFVGSAGNVATARTITGHVTISNLGVTTIGATTVTNSMLVNSSTTIGTTAIALGASSTTLAGLTSVTSTTFIGALTGNASTATILATARNINGVSFNGSADITITAAAGTLTGTTLNATVVNSSLTSLGTISTGVWNGTAIADTYISSAAVWNAKQVALVSGTNIKTLNSTSLLGSGDFLVVGDSARRRMARSGQYIPIKHYMGGPGSSGTGISASTMFIDRIDIPETVTITDIACGVTTAAAGQFVRMAIYSGDTITGTLTLVANSDTGDIDASTTGVKNVTYATPFTLTKGTQYWRMIKVSSTSLALSYYSNSDANIRHTDGLMYPCGAYSATYVTPFPSTITTAASGFIYGFYTALKIQ